MIFYRLADKIKKRLFSPLPFIVGGFLFCSVFIAAFPSYASASATLSLIPASGSYIMGNNFSISVTVNTGGAAINAAEADLIFDKSKFVVSSISTNQSIFTIWVKYPSFSNANGTISFSGGAPNPGFSGTGSIFTINFKGIALGSGDVSFTTGGKVLLNDGLGTDILSQTSGGTYNILPVPPSVSCSASPNSTTTNHQVTFSATASGGTGSYGYSWSNACTGTSSTCTNSYGAPGLKTATVTATSGNLSSSANCSVNVGLPGLNVSCSSSAESIDINQPVIFSAEALGGTGSYTYSWSNACTGTSSTCTNSYDAPGLKTATVTATSGNLSSSANCLLAVNAICSTVASPQHNICSYDEKCVSAYGIGQDQCQTDNDCGAGFTGITQEPVKVVETVTQIVKEQIPESVKAAAKEVKKAVETPQGSIATKSISTTGAVVATAEVAAAIIFSPFEIFLNLIRLFGIFLTTIGLRKRIKPWGVVYDSVTKQPLDPVYVVLKDLQGKSISSAITDLDGRYGFLASPGVYQLSVNKTNYVFPSQKLAGRTNDELYDDLYFGETIEIKQDGETIIKNIPMDSLKFDWNEFAKRDKKLMRFYSRLDIVLRKIFDLFFVVGFVVAIVAYFAAPYPYNLIILITYLVLLFLRTIGIKPKTYGRISNAANGNPLSFAVLRVMMPDLSVEVAHKVADKYGRYYCLVPKGKYYVKIEKKNDDGSYSLVYISPVIDASKKGIIKKSFYL